MNVPALMYSTNLHDDYQTPRDNPARIDYPKLTRMAQWIYMTGWFVANAPQRPSSIPDSGWSDNRNGAEPQQR